MIAQSSNCILVGFKKKILSVEKVYLFPSPINIKIERKLFHVSGQFLSAQCCFLLFLIFLIRDVLNLLQEDAATLPGDDTETAAVHVEEIGELMINTATEALSNNNLNKMKS